MLEQCPQAVTREQNLVHKWKGGLNQEQGLFTHSERRKEDAGRWANVSTGSLRKF